MNLTDYRCAAIADAVVSGLPQYGWQRGATIRAVGLKVLQDVNAIGLGGRMPRFTYVYVLSKFAESRMHSTALSVLGWMWNAVGCANQHVQIGTYTRSGEPGQPPTVGPWQWECGFEEFEISFSGGIDWYPVDIWICTQVPS